VLLLLLLFPAGVCKRCGSTGLNVGDANTDTGAASAFSGTVPMRGLGGTRKSSGSGADTYAMQRRR
jgi:hypothetical protein